MANPEWVKGMASPNPKGRPPRAREAALLAITYEIVNADAWRGIVRKAVLDAMGKKQVTAKETYRDNSGRVINKGDAVIIDDDRSTAQGRNLARCFLRDTIIGKPTEYVKLDNDDSAYAEFSAYTDEQIAEILATIERLRRSGGGGSDTEGGGAEAE